MKEIRRHALVLGAFALAVALLTGLVHHVTRDDIAFQQEEAGRRALYEVLPPNAHDNDLLESAFTLAPGDKAYRDLELLGLREARQAYRARLDGKPSGVILPVVARGGYSGDIDLLVGIGRDGAISGARVLRHRETPGLGDKIEVRVDDWILGFDGKSLGKPPEPRWRVRKDGGDFDQFAGATITPRAVVEALRRALLFFERNRDILLEQHGGD